MVGGRSHPVALFLDEGRETFALASQAGFRCFTGVEEFKRYVLGEILAAETAS